jgi:hypothetical protein
MISSKTKYIKYKTKYLILKSTMDINTSIYSLLKSKDESFIFVNLDINKTDTSIIKSLKIDHDSQFSYFGKFDKLSESINIFFLEYTTQPVLSKKLANIFMNKIVEPYLKATFNEYLWLTIRISVPNNDFDIHRWHADGYYYNVAEYSKKQLPQVKLAGALIGPTTLFINKSGLNEMYYDMFRELYKGFDYKNFDVNKDIENRKFIDNVLSKYDIVQPQENQASIFIVGLQNKSAIHSEPKMNANRLFYSIVSGNKNEIKDLATKWNKQFIE